VTSCSIADPVPADADLTPADLAGVLDQLYRARHSSGPPRRFSATTGDLRELAGRRHLRPEFIEKAGRELEASYGILMSHPRAGAGTLLGFASRRIFASWQVVPEAAFQTVLNDRLDVRDRLPSIRARLRKLYELNHSDSKNLCPIVLSKHQFCLITAMYKFSEVQLTKILERSRNTTSKDRIVVFSHGLRSKQIFGITREDYIGNWSRRTKSDWRLARKRYDLDEDS
jgi:hypothetical protein